MTLREFINSGSPVVSSMITDYTGMTVDEFDKFLVIKYASWELFQDYTDPLFMVTATDILLKANKYKYDTLLNSAELTLSSGMHTVSDTHNSGDDVTSHTGNDTATRTGSDTTSHNGTDTSSKTGSDTTKHTGDDTHTKTGTDTTTNDLTATSTNGGTDKTVTETKHGLTQTTTPNTTTTTTPGQVTTTDNVYAYDSSSVVPEHQTVQAQQVTTEKQTGTNTTASTGTDTVTATSTLGSTNTTKDTGTSALAHDTTDKDSYNSTMTLEHGLTDTTTYDSSNKTEYDTTDTQTYDSKNTLTHGHQIHEETTQTYNTPDYVDKLRQTALFSLTEIIAADIVNMIAWAVFDCD